MGENDLQKSQKRGNSMNKQKGAMGRLVFLEFKLESRTVTSIFLKVKQI